MKWISVFAAGLALAVASCAGSPPSGGLVGRLDTTVLSPLPEEPAVAIDAGDDLGAVLGEALAARGVAIDAAAGLVATPRVVLAPATVEAGFGGVGLAGVIGSSGTRDVGLSIGFPIFGLGPAIAGNYRYEAEIIIAERNGGPLWQARARGLADIADEAALARALFPLMVENLGRSVYGLEIAVDPKAP